MKTFKALLTAGALVALAIGCSTTSEKDMLSAAGFKAVPATTPQQESHLESLPSDKITPVQRSGTVRYVFPDKKNNILYVGNQEQYQRYQNLRFQNQMEAEQLSAAEMYSEAPWGVWGPWGGPGWAWGY
jgi:hypothetical protein